MNLVLSYQPMSFAKTITLPLADIPTSTPEEIRLEVKLSHQKVTLYRGTVTVSQKKPARKRINHTDTYCIGTLAIFVTDL